MKGLDYACDGRGLVPGAAVTEWLRHQIAMLERARGATDRALDRFMTSRPQLLLFVDGSKIPCMAATESTMLALGTPAPAFRLADFNGKVTSLEDFAAARGLVVAFICNHCPYVK